MISAKFDQLSRRVMGAGTEVAEIKKEEVAALLSAFEELRTSKTGPEDVALFQAEQPLLAAWLLDLGTAATQDLGTQDAAVEAFARRVLENRKQTQWSALGIAPEYEGLVRDLCQMSEKDADLSVLQRRPGKDGTPTWRACLKPEHVEPLLPPANPLARSGVFGQRDIPALLAKTLSRMDVLPDVQIIGTGQLATRAAPELVHLPPEDLTLLVDNASIRDRAAALGGDAAFCGRMVGGNAFAMPWTCYTGMRGIAYGMSKGAGIEEVIARVKQRLRERGVAEPEVIVTERGGYNVLALPSDQARLLLAPIAVGDPSTALSTVPIAYDTSARDYFSENGILCDQLAIAAYQTPELAKGYLKTWGFDQVTPLDSQAADAQGFVAFDKEKNTIAISFRGSKSDKDWQADADTRHVDGSAFGGGKVARGTNKQFMSLLPQLEAALKQYSGSEAPNIIIAGHSLGGALAELCLAYLMNKGVHVSQVYTVEAPAVGDAVYCKTNASRVAASGTVYVRTENFGDVVPIERPGARHLDFGAVAYFDKNGGLGHKPGWFDRVLSGDGFVGKLAGGRLSTSHDVNLILGLRRKARDVPFSIRS